MKGRVKNGTFFMHPFYRFERRISIPPRQVRRERNGGRMLILTRITHQILGAFDLNL